MRWRRRRGFSCGPRRFGAPPPALRRPGAAAGARRPPPSRGSRVRGSRVRGSRLEARGRRSLWPDMRRSLVSVPSWSTCTCTCTCRCTCRCTCTCNCPTVGQLDHDLFRARRRMGEIWKCFHGRCGAGTALGSACFRTFGQGPPSRLQRGCEGAAALLFRAWSPRLGPRREGPRREGPRREGPGRGSAPRTLSRGPRRRAIKEGPGRRAGGLGAAPAARAGGGGAGQHR